MRVSKVPLGNLEVKRRYLFGCEVCKWTLTVVLEEDGRVRQGYKVAEHMLTHAVRL